MCIKYIFLWPIILHDENLKKSQKMFLKERINNKKYYII